MQLVTVLRTLNVSQEEFDEATVAVEKILEFKEKPDSTLESYMKYSMSILGPKGDRFKMIVTFLFIALLEKSGVDVDALAMKGSNLLPFVAPGSDTTN